MVRCTGRDLTVCVGVSSASVSAVSVVNEMLPVTGSAQGECEPVCRMNDAGKTRTRLAEGILIQRGYRVWGVCLAGTLLKLLLFNIMTPECKPHCVCVCVCVYGCV